MLYANGQRESEKIDLANVGNTLPITLVIGAKDEECSPDMAERIFNELSNADVTKRYEDSYGHWTFAWRNGTGDVGRIIADIEDGGARSEGIALLSAAQHSEQVEDSVNYAAIIGASLAVFGAAATYAIRRSMKKDNDF